MVGKLLEIVVREERRVVGGGVEEFCGGSRQGTRAENSVRCKEGPNSKIAHGDAKVVLVRVVK